MQHSRCASTKIFNESAHSIKTATVTLFKPIKSAGTPDTSFFHGFATFFGKFVSFGFFSFLGCFGFYTKQTVETFGASRCGLGQQDHGILCRTNAGLDKPFHGFVGIDLCVTQFPLLFDQRICAFFLSLDLGRGFFGFFHIITIGLSRHLERIAQGQIRFFKSTQLAHDWTQTLGSVAHCSHDVLCGFGRFHLARAHALGHTHHFALAAHHAFLCGFGLDIIGRQISERLSSFLALAHEHEVNLHEFFGSIVLSGLTQLF